MLKIGMYDANDFIESVNLEGERYDLHFAWNQSNKTWTMDIRTSQKEDIVRGIAMVPNFPLLNQHRRTAGLPAGEIMAVVNNPTARQAIGRYDFLNGKFSLVYIPGGELSAILEASIQDNIS